MKQRLGCSVLIISILASTTLACKRDHALAGSTQVGEGVTQLAAPGDTVQPTKRGEGVTQVPELYKQADTAIAARDYVAAQNAYRLAIAAEPDSAQGYIGLGTALMLAGDPKGARAAYKDALTREPDSPSAHIGLGSIESDAGHYPAAINEYSLVLRTHPDDADAHWGLAVAYRASGDPANAALHADKFLALVPNSPLAPQIRAIAEGR